MIVYTAIIGGFNDELRPVVAPLKSNELGEPTRFICFTDAYTHDQLGWEIRPPVWQHENPRRTARWHKLMAHEALGHTDFSLWHDGSHQLTDDIFSMVKTYLDRHDFAAFRHPQRTTVKQEVAACIALCKDAPDVITKQYERYQREGFVDTEGLFETSAVLRRHNDTTIKFNELWWHELRDNSLRDQISVNYAAQKTGINAGYLSGNRVKSDHFNFFPHR